ncbi:MAG: ThuA domain-containing protein [Treponema sp.]|jgi:type 1 glutamine amidotransferase|nr:ThuA domain-containing protein [Treponema sp.]
MIDILVLCDDYWHPAEVIRRGLGALNADGYRFDIVMDAKDILSPGMIRRYPVIMSCKGNCVSSANDSPWFEEGITEVSVAELKAWTAEGGGFLSIHSANTAQAGTDPQGYGQFVGNYFIGHPARCEVKVKITGNHPIVRGLEDFTIRDEHYALDYFAEDGTELFRTISETGGNQIGGYVRPHGKGRICVMTPGHILPVWEHPSFQRLLLNALDWCAGDSGGTIRRVEQAGEKT